jgi:signal peptidase II
VTISLARRNDAIMVVVGLVVILVDQLTKRWIVAYFGIPDGRPPIPILGPYLQIIYLQNTGVAFSLLEGQAVLFVFITIAVLVIAGLYWRMRDSASVLIKITFGLILGGAVGNLLDRFAHAYVVDFIHFQIPHVFNFAVFNVADSAISLGVLALALLLWRGVPQHDEEGANLTPPRGSDSAANPAVEPAPSAPQPRVRNPNPRSS